MRTGKKFTRRVARWGGLGAEQQVAYGSPTQPWRMKGILRRKKSGEQAGGAGGAFCRILYPQGRGRARPHPGPRWPCGYKAGGRTAGEAPAMEFVSNGWIGGRGGLEDRLKRSSGRGFGPAGVTHDPSRKREFLLSDRHRSREIGPRSGESSGTSRDVDEAHGCAMMPRLAEDSATGTGRVATRRLDADDRVRGSTVRSILRAPPATR